jgi:hypothetical protein
MGHPIECEPSAAIQFRFINAAELKGLRPMITADRRETIASSVHALSYLSRETLIDERRVIWWARNCVDSAKRQVAEEHCPDVHCPRSCESVRHFGDC